MDSFNQPNTEQHTQTSSECILPTIHWTNDIEYLHAAAGYPTEETWIKAIQARNYNTWPSLIVANAHKHHPESEETQKGHMKCQCQGIRSTKTLADINKNKGDEAKSENEPNPNLQTEPKARKMKDIHIKIYNASNTQAASQKHQAQETSTS